MKHAVCLDSTFSRGSFRDLNQWLKRLKKMDFQCTWLWGGYCGVDSGIDHCCRFIGALWNISIYSNTSLWDNKRNVLNRNVQKKWVKEQSVSNLTCGTRARSYKIYKVILIRLYWELATYINDITVFYKRSFDFP